MSRDNNRNWRMAQVGRAGLLQLLCGARKPQKPRGVPGPIAGTLVARTSPPEPKASTLLDPHAHAGPTMASATESAPPLSRRSLRRQSSEIRTGCANERPSGSVRGATSRWLSLPRSHNAVRRLMMTQGVPAPECRARSKNTKRNDLKKTPCLVGTRGRRHPRWTPRHQRTRRIPTSCTYLENPVNAFNRDVTPIVRAVPRQNSARA
jgi:hypothetical protein